MRISIVIPSFGQAQYLQEAIESALNQSYYDFEVIVVDDGSTDGSLEIAKIYGNKIKVISQVNKGLASARNTGIMNATGKYVFFLDADDIMTPDCLGKIAQKALETIADVISPSFQEFGASERQVILMPNPTLEDFKQGNRVGYCSAIKRDVLLEVGGYSPRMTHGYEDYHLWFDLLTRGKKFETISEVLWFYRTKENSMYSDALKHHDELMAQIKKDFPQVYA